MAELFGGDVRTVSEHLKNIFANQELDAEAVIRKFRITASDGKNYQTQFYNLQCKNRWPMSRIAEMTDKPEFPR